MSYKKPHVSRLYTASYPVDESKRQQLPMTVMSDEIFGIYDNDIDDLPFVLKSENSYGNDRSSQLELPLENPNCLLDHYKKMIAHYEAGYEHMALLAMKWYHLEQDAEQDEVIGKLLRDIQIYRKLSGYKII